MSKLKKGYILILLLLLVVGSAACFSYAYFVSKNEEHGKLNIVVGELNYKIESDSLENNQITISSNETVEFELKITSLNEIDSKYELYYTSSDSNVTVYYDSEYDLPSDTITAKGTKTLNIQITNNSDNEVTVIFGVQGGLVNHVLSLNQGNKIDTAIPTCQYAVGEVIATFDYTGSPEEFVAQCDGIYKLEVYGAQGGTNVGLGGLGGYSYGNKTLVKDTSIYVVVGGQGTQSQGGYNGGGSTYSASSYGPAAGGGATHIGTFNNTLASHGTVDGLYIVAGGGGGGYSIFVNGSGVASAPGGSGGGLTGGDGTWQGVYTGGATQTSGYQFGQGYNNTSLPSSGGGGGLYGGNMNSNYGSAGGGSGYIDGVTDGATENGVREGNGYAQITYLGE